MRLRSYHVAVLVLVLIFGTIAGTSLAGVWVTESTKTPRLIAEGEFAGISDPADIRGSYTFADIENAFGIPASLLAAAFGMDGQPGEISAKDLEEIWGEIEGMEVGTDSLRLFVALYLGVPYLPEETTALPRAAYQILQRQSGASPDPDLPAVAETTREALAAYSDRVVALEPEATAPTGTGAGAAGSQAAGIEPEEPEEHETSTEEGVIRGATTFADLLSWGLTREQIEGVIGTEMPNRATKVRDFAAETGASFGSYRETFQGLLDALE
jgi:hypothetical protein